MLKLREIRNQKGAIEHIETSYSGHNLLNTPKLNKGNAFTETERKEFGLLGVLPERIETLDEQATRLYAQYQEKSTDLQKNLFLNSIHDVNETLFYKVVQEHLKEMLPVIYTPTVGDAVEKFSLEMRRPRGVYISYENRDQIDTLLANRSYQDIDLIVVTDGEGVLGIGDQGIGGMDISIAKLMVYTLCAGVNPHRVLAMQLDVGTNNEKLLNDPMYLGWRHKRISGQQYDEFIGQFVSAVRKTWPDIYLHWEDFGRDNARKNLERYRQDMLTFNDDMQGTGIVALSNVLAAVEASGGDMTQQRIVMLGAGTAGVGIADQIYDAVRHAGLSPEAARQCFWLIDRDGLLMEGQAGLPDFQQPYLRSQADVEGWQLDDPNKIMLADVVRNVHPTILIGCSTVHGAFTESIVKDMATHVAHPIIMPLSNPTSHCEADPKDLIEWTDAKAMIAAGSPFPPVEYKGKTIRISQGNNAFIFPGLGLGVMVAKAKKMTDSMIVVAAKTLSSFSPVRQDKNAPLLPDFDDIIDISHTVAKAVAEQAIKEGLAQIPADADLDVLIRAATWAPHYYPYKKVSA